MTRSCWLTVLRPRNFPICVYFSFLLGPFNYSVHGSFDLRGSWQTILYFLADRSQSTTGASASLRCTFRIQNNPGMQKNPGLAMSGQSDFQKAARVNHADNARRSPLEGDIYGHQERFFFSFIFFSPFCESIWLEWRGLALALARSF